MRPLFPLFVTCLAASAAPPNVLFIAVDDLRPELACYGAAHMQTPSIDAFAAEGRLFSNHYVAVPTCGASRYALMTGLRPTAATDGNDAFNLMPTSEPTVAESWVDLLRRNGWHTVSLGKVTHEPDGYRWSYPSSYDIGRSSATNPDMRFSWDEIVYGHDKWGAQRYPLFSYGDGTGRVRNVSPAFEIGVDEGGDSLPDEAYPDGQMAQAAIEKLREFSEDGQRFCMAVGFHKPHLPFNAPKDYYDLYNPATLPDANPLAKPTGANSSTVSQSGEINAYTATGDREKLRHAYFACVSYVDAQVGKVLAELDTLGLADNTLVILWGDHGWCLDDYTLLGKHVVLERALKSPLIIRAPGEFCPEVFAGVPTEGLAETVDLYPTIAEICGLAVPVGPVGESLLPVLRNPYAPGKDHVFSRVDSVQSVRTNDWRLVTAGGIDDLYDLSIDPFEKIDVSGSNPTVVGDLSARLSTPGTRPGTTYTDWAGGNPSLADPNGDADQDGASNWGEYSGGTDPLDANDHPSCSLSREDLSHLGYSADEIVYSFPVFDAADDVVHKPQSSTDLLFWSFDSLEFVEAMDLGGDRHEMRFRLRTPLDPQRFFRFSSSSGGL